MLHTNNHCNRLETVALSRVSTKNNGSMPLWQLRASYDKPAKLFSEQEMAKQQPQSISSHQNNTNGGRFGSGCFGLGRFSMDVSE